MTIVLYLALALLLEIRWQDAIFTVRFEGQDNSVDVKIISTQLFDGVPRITYSKRRNGQPLAIANQEGRNSKTFSFLFYFLLENRG